MGHHETNGFLNDEAQSVLRQEFRDPSTYNAILQAIAFGATSRNEIAQKSLADSRTLTKYLSVLEDMDLIEREFSVFVGPGDLSNASRGRYRIADHYLKFWFRFLAKNPVPIMTRAEAMSEWSSSVEPFFLEFASEAFEEVCREYLVATDHDRRNCLVGECKFRNDKVGLKVFRSLQAKSIYLPVAEDAVFHYWLFSRNGFDDALIELSERDPYLHLVSMDELLD